MDTYYNPNRKVYESEFLDAIGHRSLAWSTKDKGLVCVNMMSDSHLKNAIDHLRRNIMVAKLQHGQTSLSLLSLRYLEDEANDRGLIHETSEPF